MSKTDSLYPSGTVARNHDRGGQVIELNGPSTATGIMSTDRLPQCYRYVVKDRQLVRPWIGVSVECPPHGLRRRRRPPCLSQAAPPAFPSRPPLPARLLA